MLSICDCQYRAPGISATVCQSHCQLLSGLADHFFLQLVKISVHTVTEEGESPDPKKLIILNPRKFITP